VTIVTELDLPAFEYTASDLAADIYHQRLASARKYGWLARSPLGFAVLDHEAGEFFLRSKAAVFPGRMIADLVSVTSGPARELVEGNLLNNSGEPHRRMRTVAAQALNPRATARWRPAMRQFLAELWSAIGPVDHCEFIAAVAKPYPAMTMTALLGAPSEDAMQLDEWARWARRQFDMRALTTQLADIERASLELHEYVEALFRQQKADPPQTLIGALVSADGREDGLSHGESVNLAVNVLTAGIGTAQAQMAHALRLFAEHPEQWTLLADRPELAPQAVSEVLRFQLPTPSNARFLIEDVEYRGVVFPQGTVLTICLEPASLEPSPSPSAEAATGEDQTAIEPFDITASREDRLLTFGIGPHHCLGVHPARAELEEALTFLAPRMPELALDGDPEFGLGGAEGLFEVKALPLRWTPAS
jgi:cytochrome P450